MLVKALGEFLIANGPWVAGVDMWYDYMPEEPHDAVVLTQYAADEPLGGFSKVSPPVERPRIQIASRAAPDEAVVAYRQCRDAYTLLCTVVDKTLVVQVAGQEITYSVTMTPANTPVLTGRDENARPIYTCNFTSAVTVTGVLELIP